MLWPRLPGCSSHTCFCFSLSFTPFNAPAMLIASMCGSAVCFLSCRLSCGHVHHLFSILAVFAGKCVQKAHRCWFCRRRDGCLCRSSSAPGLVFRTVRLLTTLVGMTQSPRPLIFSKSKAHPLTRTPQLVNRRHASNSWAHLDILPLSLLPPLWVMLTWDPWLRTWHVALSRLQP